MLAMPNSSNYDEPVHLSKQVTGDDGISVYKA